MGEDTAEVEVGGLAEVGGTAGVGDMAEVVTAANREDMVVAMDTEVGPPPPVAFSTNESIHTDLTPLTHHQFKSESPFSPMSSSRVLDCGKIYS